MNLHDFYLEHMFNDYVEDMPSWLAKEADKEIEIFQIAIELLALRKKNLKVLDIGCGNCRIFKKIDFSWNSPTKKPERIGTDIFKAKDLPKEFTKWLLDNQISYRQIPSDSKTSFIPSKWGEFDIITCLGVDCHLDCVNPMISSSLNALKEDGALIWQINRKDTFAGKRLQFNDRKLKYKYHKVGYYQSLPYYVSTQSTKISHIFAYKRYGK